MPFLPKSRCCKDINTRFQLLHMCSSQISLQHLEQQLGPTSNSRPPELQLGGLLSALPHHRHLSAQVGEHINREITGSSRHSLCYSYLKVSEPSQGLPQFLSVIHLDNQPIARYDILNGKTVPLVPWIEVEEMRTPERMFGADLEQLSELNHQTGWLHTWQVDLGCELREDGSKRGFLHYGYDGMDFISFDKETLRWVPAQPQARMVKEKREDDPRQSQRNKFFLEETCIEWLQRYLSYQKGALKKTEPPVGKVTGKVVDDSIEVFICQAFGFYPKEIQATWTRDREVCKYETLPRNVAPNSDGTYYIWLSIEIDPKERDHFRCHIEHEGLQEPLILAFKEDPARTWWIPVGIVAAIILVAFLFQICWRSIPAGTRLLSLPSAPLIASLPALRPSILHPVRSRRPFSAFLRTNKMFLGCHALPRLSHGISTAVSRRSSVLSFLQKAVSPKKAASSARLHQTPTPTPSLRLNRPPLLAAVSLGVPPPTGGDIPSPQAHNNRGTKWPVGSDPTSTASDLD
ncbi:zinc-alpha-2-glycoprotein-like [Erythrolamprus reginae]|uniref:zinc-alpha-2-glycoprotein-like n=1 Tax=Erythrolamprus reginae TaxID=121349 RepID=UPI00396C7393